MEAPGILVLGSAGHAAIAEGEEADVAEADLRHCGAQFEFADVAKGFRGAVRRVANLADFAAGGADEGDASATSDKGGEGSGGLPLIIGVAVNGEDSDVVHGVQS